jgi:RimJ/RimL family protein N-acetyltransferase|tara:strand:+ start:1348 stop:1902 length:555 start_codon:yes stop_codon:yes gene_type:complete
MENKTLQTNIFLDGENIYLRPLNENDLKGNYFSWLNDQVVLAHSSNGRFPHSIHTLNNYVKSSKISNDLIVLAIMHKKSETHIGNISLQSINWIDRNAEIAFLLGDKSFWSKGVMTEAGELLIKHAFQKLNLHRVCCGTSSSNKSMQNLAIKLGMKKEGVRKDAIFNSGKYHDIYEYGVINQLK